MRRVLAIDAGSRSLKLVLVERAFSEVRILREQAIDLQEEGLVSATELSANLEALLDQWGRPPVAITLPQHLSTSQIIDLPPGPEAEVRKQIEEETKRLSGVSETAIIYDFTQVDTTSEAHRRYWVTLCQEGEIREQIKRLGLEHEDICEVTTTANALLAAFAGVEPQPEAAVLVHTGAQSTVVVVCLAGSGVFASSFPVGGDFFTRALAEQLKCTVDVAEDLKRTKNFFRGPDALADFPVVVEGWLAELRRQLQEWIGHRPGGGPSLSAFRIFTSGGGFRQVGLVDYLNGRTGLKFEPWPEAKPGTTCVPAEGFQVAFGAALQALGLSAQPASLLPPDRRALWRRRVVRQRIEIASAGVLIGLFLVLALGTWQQYSLYHRKATLLERVNEAYENAQSNAFLTDTLLAEYGEVRPLLERQQQTTSALKTLGLLEAVRSNRSLWFVLLADQQTYFTQPLPVVPTNAPGATNALAAARRAALAMTNYSAAFGTNGLPWRPGFVAELCVPEDAEPARRTFSQVVNDLKQDPLFARVDSLSEDLRRPLADPGVLLADRHFALSLELAEAQWPRLAVPKRRSSPPATNGISRALLRPLKPVGDDTDTPSAIP